MDTERYIERECSKHGITKYVYVESNKKYICVKCRSEAVQRKRYKLKHDLIEYKGGKCEICGYNKCESALEFHHLNPEEKEFAISSKGYTRSFELCKKEVDKCILVCANCHREIHENEIEKLFLLKSSNDNKIKIDEEKVKSLLNQRLTQKDISNTIGISVSSLKRFLKKNNLNKQKESPSQINEDILELMLKYKNYTKVGKVLGISDNAVRKRVKKLGYPPNIQELLCILTEH